MVKESGDDATNEGQWNGSLHVWQGRRVLTGLAVYIHLQKEYTVATRRHTILQIDLGPVTGNTTRPSPIVTELEAQPSPGGTIYRVLVTRDVRACSVTLFVWPDTRTWRRHTAARPVGASTAHAPLREAFPSSPLACKLLGQLL